MAEPNPPFPFPSDRPHSPYSRASGQPFGLPYPAQPAYGIPASAPPGSDRPDRTVPVPVTAALTPSPLPLPVTAAYPYGDQVIAQIGEIQVTSTMVRTPVGQFPLHGSRWDISDHWLTEQKTPTWAVVLAVAGFFCLTLLSLLFLLVKETVYRGMVQVRVSNGPYVYVSRIPVTDQLLVPQIYQQVNYVRSLSAM